MSITTGILRIGTLTTLSASNRALLYPSAFW